MTKTFLTAEWRHLLMLNYEVDPLLLEPRVPSGTELDHWNGKTFLSIVGFQFLKTRVLGVPIPFHRNFVEINLRFYVRRKGEDGWRRGVVFIKEFVPRTAIAFVARWVYNENYVACRMGAEVHSSDVENELGSVDYSWTLGGVCNSVRAEFNGSPQPLVAGSEEEFITEHYWGYARQRNGGTVEYQVEHPSWSVWRAARAELKCDVETSYGREFCIALARKPTTAFVAEGSAVAVHRGRRIV